MTDQQARALLSRVFHALFDPAATAEEVGTRFSLDYRQIADGREIDRAGFIDHVRLLKDVVQSGSVTLETVIASGPTIASLHVVNVRKKTGEAVQMKVHAFFEIEHGLIRRTEELTHMMVGGQTDRDLGSRTSG